MSGTEWQRTALYLWHQAHGARLVEFGGWMMPLLYSSIVEEHGAVRTRAGLFDISHMGRLFFQGPDVPAWIDRATTNDVSRLRPGRIQYSLMANEDAGVLDDVLVYRLPGPGGASHCKYMVVCNASNRAAVVDRFEETRDARSASMTDETIATAMIAVQGPSAIEVLGRILDTEQPLESAAYYACATTRILGVPGLLSRTGYTGEDGFELILPSEHAEEVWSRLLEAGRDRDIRPCGLGARDTLRFEAAMPLYGHELDATINPYEAGLGWAVKLDKGEFLGREALRRVKSHPGRRRVGLALDGKRIARQGYSVTRVDQSVGVVTSGTFAPTLARSLAMALVDPGFAAPGTSLAVDLRGQSIAAEVTPLPFYRRVSSPAGLARPASEETGT